MRSANVYKHFISWKYSVIINPRLIRALIATEMNRYKDLIANGSSDLGKDIAANNELDPDGKRTG